MKPSAHTLTRVALVALGLLLVQRVLGVLFPGGPPIDPVPGVLGSLVLPFASALLLAGVLAYPVSRSRLTGGARFAAVFLAVAGLSVVLTHVEAAVFLDTEPGELTTAVVKSTLEALALSILAVALFPRRRAETPVASPSRKPLTLFGWVLRLALCAVVYVVLYMTAGLLILPSIRAFYEAQGTLDVDPAVLFPLQLVRGTLYVAFVLPLLRSLSAPRRQAALAMAFMIPVVHGVAGLLLPNELMPAQVRYLHMLEIGWSNFVFGLLIGYLFWKAPKPGAAEEAASAAAVAA